MAWSDAARAAARAARRSKAGAYPVRMATVGRGKLVATVQRQT